MTEIPRTLPAPTPDEACGRCRHPYSAHATNGEMAGCLYRDTGNQQDPGTRRCGCDGFLLVYVQRPKGHIVLTQARKDW